jgi:hypothetical protein
MGLRGFDRLHVARARCPAHDRGVKICEAGICDAGACAAVEGLTAASYFTSAISIW